MSLDGVSLKDFGDKAAEDVEQDQTAHTCSLIFFYILCKTNSWSLTAV